jgi:hypothetical protein
VTTVAQVPEEIAPVPSAEVPLAIVVVVPPIGAEVFSPKVRSSVIPVITPPEVTTVASAIPVDV